jgi:hypothetical protein
MMLFPYNNEPDTGSRIPSISTGGAAINAIMKTEVAVKNAGQGVFKIHVTKAPRQGSECKVATE